MNPDATDTRPNPGAAPAGVALLGMIVASIAFLYVARLLLLMILA